MSLPTRQAYAISFKTAKPCKSIKQAPELQAGALLMLITHARKGSTITHVFSRLVLLLTVGCIRVLHQTRSRLTAVDATYLTPCDMGKSRSGGVRSPFDWIVPRCLGPDEDTFGR